MSEISSLHEEDQRNVLRNGLGRLRNQAMTPIRDIEEESLLSSDTRRAQPFRQDRYEEDRYRGPGNYERRQRSHSMDNLDNLDRRHYNHPRDQQFSPHNRGRRNSDEEHNYDNNRRHRDCSPDNRNDYYGGRRSRSRDDLRDLDCSRNNPDYDDRFLEDVLRRKQQKAGNRDGVETASNSTGRSGMRRNDDDDFPPPPPPYTETESLSSRGKQDKKFKKSNALSRDSLVV